jgi:hypothetical protein
MKKIFVVAIISIALLILTSCSTEESVSLGYIQNSRIVPNSSILISPFNVENQELQTALTQDFFYSLVKRNTFRIFLSDKEIKSDISEIKSLNPKYDYVVITKILRYDIKDFRPIFSIDMTVYNTFDGSVAWKIRYPFYWNDPQTEKFVSDSFGKNYNFERFYNSKDSIREFADIILEAISYNISKIK